MIFRYNLPLLFLAGVVLIGCQPHVDVNKASDTAFRLARTGVLDSVLAAGQMADSILKMNPRPRYWSDSLAREDSLDIAYLYRLRTSHLYHRRDTVEAALSFIETIPWSHVWSLKAQAQFWRFYANDVSEAVEITRNPNMAKLAYKAFMEAERIAAQHGDTAFYARVMETKGTAFANLAALPDSVRLAFAPSPAPSGPSPWSFMVVALVLGFIVGGSTWRVYRKKEQQHHLTSKTVEQPTGSTYDVLDALWIVCNDTSSIPKDIEVTVCTTCRKPTSQRGMFMYAGLMAGLGGEDADPLKVANTVRSRLLRFFKRQQWEMMPGVQLPRDRDEWYTWFNARGMATRKPSERLDQENSYV